MTKLLSQGIAITGTLDVYSNFQGPLNGNWAIYMGPGGQKLGGHALGVVGYGKEGRTPYWILQNSWGPSWGKDGYARILRGKNVCGIEERAYYMRAWVQGGKEPPCFDGKDTGYTSGSGKAIPCSVAKDGPYGNLCQKERVKKTCPVSCGLCKGSGKSAKAPPPKKVGTACCWEPCKSSGDCSTNMFCCPRYKKCMDRSTGSSGGPNCDKCRNKKFGRPSPPPAPKRCRDQPTSGLLINGRPAPCSSLRRSPFGNLCLYAGGIFGARCPKSCGMCRR